MLFDDNLFLHCLVQNVLWLLLLRPSLLAYSTKCATCSSVHFPPLHELLALDISHRHPETSTLRFIWLVLPIISAVRPLHRLGSIWSRWTADITWLIEPTNICCTRVVTERQIIFLLSLRCREPIVVDFFSMKWVLAKNFHVA